MGKRLFRLIPAAGIVGSILLLVIAILTGPVADARHAVIHVDSRTVDRTALRARIVLDQTMADARARERRAAASNGDMTIAEAATVESMDQAVATDPIRAAIDGLARDAVIDEAAAERGIVITGEIQTEAMTDALRDFGVRLRIVRFGLSSSSLPATTGDWPRPPSNADPTAAPDRVEQLAADRLASAFSNGVNAADAVSSLIASGWRATSSEGWLPAVGPVDGVTPELLAKARDLSVGVGSVIGPVFDPISGTMSAAVVLSRNRPDVTGINGTITAAHIDGNALAVWATARAEERALRSALAGSWATGPSARVRAAEVVIGSSTLEGRAGPYVSFAHLVVGHLPPSDRAGSDDRAAAIALADGLRGLPATARATRFDGFIADANRVPSSDPLGTSGELGYFTHDQLLPELADLAFAGTTRTGDILGPVATAAGQELFLVRGRYDGVLDDRTSAALVEARSAPDLLALAGQISPAGEASRASGTLWRALDEFAGSSAALAAYRDTPIGDLSEPVAFAGEILVVRPLERITGALDRPSLDRLGAGAFEAWLTARLAAATIIRDPEPLPGLQVTPDASASPGVPSAVPIETPNLPNVSAPGVGASFGVPTPRVLP